MRTGLNAYFGSRRARAGHAPYEANPITGLRAANPADNLIHLTAPVADADDRDPPVAQPASTLRGDSKRLESTHADWHAMRLRSDGGLAEHSGANHRNSDRFRAWGTLALFRSELEPLPGEQIGVVEDASPGGLYIAIHQPPPVGTVLQMRIYCQAGPPGKSMVELSGRVLRCQVREPTGAGVQVLDFADGERGRQAWLALVRQASPNAALTAPPLRPPPLLLPAALRRTAATGLAADKNRQQWKAKSRR